MSDIDDRFLAGATNTKNHDFEIERKATATGRMKGEARRRRWIRPVWLSYLSIDSWFLVFCGQEPVGENPKGKKEIQESREMS
jgi:hypothetical protein